MNSLSLESNASVVGRKHRDGQLALLELERILKAVVVLVAGSTGWPSLNSMRESLYPSDGWRFLLFVRDAVHIRSKALGSGCLR